MPRHIVSRIKRDFEEVVRSEMSNQCTIKLDRIGDDWTDFCGEIAGPPGTAYEGGKFLLEIKVPERYPVHPPRVRFITRIWHPNICCATGAIHVDFLEENWSDTMSLRTVLVSLQALLTDPKPNDPMEFAIAIQHEHNYPLFVRTAQHWTTVYAGGKLKFPEFTSKIITFGIDEHVARAVLSKNDWDVADALLRYLRYGR